MNFRQIQAILHSWFGIIVLWVIFFIFLRALLLIFERKLMFGHSQKQSAIFKQSLLHNILRKLRLTISTNMHQMPKDGESQ